MNNGFRLHALDGWRGLCALLVAILHFHAMGYFHSIPLVQNAWLAVDFFFVLSGFVITHAYGGRVKDWHDFKNFIGRRFGRVYPLHLATLLAILAMHGIMVALSQFAGKGTLDFSGSTGVDAFFANLLLIHSLGIYDYLTWNDPSWSISVEFYVYIVFALVMLLARSHLTLAAAILVLASIAMLCFVSPEYMKTATEYGFFRCIAGFGTGHLVYRLRLHFSPRLNHSSLAECFALVLAIFAFLYMAEGPATLLTPVVFGVVLFVYATGSGCISRFLSNRAMTFIGERSYSIYMVHQVVIDAMVYSTSILENRLGMKLRILMPGTESIYAWHSPSYPWLMDILMLGYVAIVLTVAAYTYRYIETPWRKRFNALFSRK